MKMSLLLSTFVRHFLSDCVDNDLVLDEDNCIECDEVQSGLEKIDDETDALDITFVKVNDPRYAKKYGVSKLPALVYFRRKFPSIYRGTVPSTELTLSTVRYIQILSLTRTRYWSGSPPIGTSSWSSGSSCTLSCPSPSPSCVTQVPVLQTDQQLRLTIPL